MKRIALFVMMSVVHVAFLHAQQSDINDFRTVLSENRVLMEVDYRIVVSETRIEGVAWIEVQGDCYVMRTEGTYICCDAETIWTIDSGAKEVYIESVSDGGQSGLDNALVALIESDAVKCVFSDDGTPIHMAVLLPDGMSVSADILSFAIEDKKTVTSYRPQCEFGSDWIVTDLR